LGREVEAIQRLEVGEPGRLQTTLRGTLLPFDQFQLAELQEKPQMIDVVHGAPTSDFIALRVDRRQLQRLQMMLQQHHALGFQLFHG